MHLRCRYGIGVWVVLTFAAASLVWFLALAPGASADGNAPSVPPSVGVVFERSHHRPVAGKLFTGVVVVDMSATSDNLSVSCGPGVIGHKHWYGSQHSFFAGSDRNVVVCEWRIPKAAAGKVFRAVAVSAVTTGEIAGPGTFSWRVRR
ncbi:MAG TPA: hypothetical protein VE985_02545 [Gaiellaceae bacterium]|nr:hypothetical protein [Gaiellaceae bacterium]